MILRLAEIVGLIVHMAAGPAIFYSSGGRVNALILMCLGVSAFALAAGCVASRGTANRGVFVWGGFAWLAAAALELETLRARSHPGPNGASIALFALVLFAVAALASVLNARAPGSGAWALLMGLLVVIFAMAFAEERSFKLSEMQSRAVELGFPWNAFLGVLVFVSTTNFLFTRYAAAAFAAGLGLFLGLLELWFAAPPFGDPRLSRAIPWLISLGVWLAWCMRRPRGAAITGGRMDRLWLWFRDHWGVVWGLRVMERFNESARLRRWPYTLAWHGLTATKGATDRSGESVDAEVYATFRDMLRRFASPERIDRAGWETSRDGCDAIAARQ